jgi:hypothetical protein
MEITGTSRASGEIISTSSAKLHNNSNTAEISSDEDAHTQIAPITVVEASPTGTIFEKFFEGTFIDYWWKCLVACAVMLCSLMAIILILALHQDRPLPNWPFSITLNALISTMLAILKSSMLAIIAAGT